MLAFARAQVGKPFSNSGMARSILYPRQSTLKTFYCAGAQSSTAMVHSLLTWRTLLHRIGRGHSQARRLDVRSMFNLSLLMHDLTPPLSFVSSRSQDSNPGAAAPYSLYKLYSKQAAATANPYMLRQAGNLKLTTLGMWGGVRSLHPPTAQTPMRAPARPAAHVGGSYRTRPDSPPRASFRVLAPGALHAMDGPQLTLSLTSLRG